MVEDLNTKVTRGGVYFIDSFEYNSDQEILEFRFLASELNKGVHSPILDNVVRVLIFQGVRGYYELWAEEEEFDSKNMYTFIGIWESHENGSVRYGIQLDDFEMYFLSDVLPVVKDFVVLSE